MKPHPPDCVDASPFGAGTVSPLAQLPDRAVDWYTSSYTNGGQCCVEVLHRPEATYVRDTKWGRLVEAVEPRPVLAVSPAGWAACLKSLRARASTGSDAELVVREDGSGESFVFSVGADDPVLHFHEGEMAAFQAGVVDGEFDRPS